MSPWFVVNTHMRAESMAESHPKSQEFQTYLPRHSRRVCHARRVEVVATQLFPRYLFIALDLVMACWRAVRSTMGGTGLVSGDDRPLPVPPGVVEAIQNREDKDGLVHLDERAPFAAGDWMLVTEGVFCNHIGLVTNRPDDQRVVVRLNLLSRQVKIAFSTTTLGQSA